MRNKNWTVGELADWQGIIGKITAVTADARTGKQESIILRFEFNNKAKEIKVNDPFLNRTEVVGGLITPNWLTQDGDVMSISDRD